MWDLVYCGIRYQKGLSGVSLTPQDFDLFYNENQIIGSTDISIVHKETNIKAFTLRRYEFETFCNWLNTKLGFTIENYDLVDTNTGIAIGSFLLK